jgi:hypothetical protein
MGGDLTYRRHKDETIFELQVPLAEVTQTSTLPETVH